MDCTCPRCASSETQSLAMIYAHGTLRSRGRVFETTASHGARAPAPITYLGPSVAIFLSFLIMGAWLLSRLPRDAFFAVGRLGNMLQAAFVFVPVLAWVTLARRYNATVWRERRKAWERSFQCGRCGQIFLLSRVS